MKTQVQKWGNSLAVRIPKPFASDLGLDHDSPIELALEDGCLVLRPIEKPKYELSILLLRVTEDNRHNEYDLGDPAGSEQW